MKLSLLDNYKINRDGPLVTITATHPANHYGPFTRSLSTGKNDNADVFHDEDKFIYVLSSCRALDYVGIEKISFSGKKIDSLFLEGHNLQEHRADFFDLETIEQGESLAELLGE